MSSVAIEAKLVFPFGTRLSKESGEKWASPQEYAELSIEPESEVITCFLSLARRHVHENGRRSIARAGDVATGRLRSLGDRVNSSAKQYLEIAHELSHYSAQLPIGRSEPFHHQQVLYFELKYSHCR